MDFKKIWNDIVNFFTNNVWNIVKFFAVLVIGIIVVKLLINLTKKMLKKTKMENITRNFIVATLRVILYLILVLTLFSVVGIQVNGIITALSALILAIGMALQNIIANVANGIIIVSTQMFKKGDYISVDSVSGSVYNINFLFTTLNTPDNRRVTIPNSIIVNSCVTNNGSYDRRRVEFNFLVAYESDVEKVKEILKNVMLSNGCIYTDPAPFCRLKEIASNGLNFFCHCWCDSEDYWDVYYYVMENAYNELKRNNIKIPYGQIEIRERKDAVELPVAGEGLAERQEKVRKQKHKSFDLEDASISDLLKLTKHKKPKKENEQEDKSKTKQKKDK